MEQKAKYQLTQNKENHYRTAKENQFLLEDFIRWVFKVIGHLSTKGCDLKGDTGGLVPKYFCRQPWESSSQSLSKDGISTLKTPAWKTRLTPEATFLSQFI